MKTLFSICFLLINIIIYSQHLSMPERTNWYFGYNAGITFKNGPPEILPGGMISIKEGSSILSDANGSLLFYTDGHTVYNSKHRIVQNGSDLLGSGSSTQSSLIIPFLNDPNKFFIFTTGALEFTPGLHYSVLDMSLDRGNGAIISEIKNIPIPLNGNYDCSEKLAAFPHANEKDYWLITYLDNYFYAFLIKNDQLQINSPVISEIGEEIVDSNDDNLKYSYFGEIKFSWKGDKLAAAFGKNSFRLYDFNNQTGEITGEKILMSTKFKPAKGYYGMEFSPNDQLLYLGGINLYQYDIVAGGDCRIIANSFLSNDYYALELGPDRKIYIAQMNNYLSVIEDPNNKADPGFKKNALYTQEESYIGLPNFARRILEEIWVNGNPLLKDVCVDENTIFTFNTNSSLSYTLDWVIDGKTFKNTKSPEYVFPLIGEYPIELKINYAKSQSIIKKTITVHPKVSKPVIKVLND